MKPKSRNLFATFASLVLLSIPVSHAGTIYYDGGGTTTTGLGWGTAANWSSDLAGTTDPAAAPLAADDVIFSITGAVDGVVGMNDARAANSLTFSSAVANTLMANTTATTARSLTIGAGGVTIDSGAGAVTFGVSTRGALTTTLGASQSWTQNGANLFSVVQPVNLQGNNLTLAGSGAGGTTISGKISGTGAVIVSKSGGNVTLSGVNDYSGGLSQTGTGAVLLGNNSAAGTGTISLASTQASTSATFILGGSGTALTVNNNIQIDITAGRQNIQNNNTSGGNLGGDITVNGNAANAIVFNNSAASSTFTVGGATPDAKTITAATYANQLSFRGSTNNTRLGVLNSRINAPNAVVDLNTFGNWTFNSTGNDWSYTNISSSDGGVLKLGVNDTLDTGGHLQVGTAAATNGSLDMNGKNQTLAGLAGGNGTTATVHIKNTGTANSTLTLSGLTANRSFAGIIDDDGAGKTLSLVVNNDNAFVQTLTAANTFTGTVTVAKGTLAIPTINNSAANGTLGNQAAGAAGAVVLGSAGGNSGVLRYTGTGAAQTAGTISNKTFSMATGGTGVFEVTDAASSLTLSNNTASQGIIGGGNFEKKGAGTLVLQGGITANTYAGSTIISEGTLQLGINSTSGALSPNTTSITIAAGATLAINRSNAVTQGAAGILGNGTIPLTGDGSLVQMGSGTTTLTATNTYTGTTTISGGSLVTALPTNLAGYTNAGKVIFGGGRLDITMGDGTTTGWSTSQLDTLLSNAVTTSGNLAISTANGDATQGAAFDAATNFGGLGLIKIGANTLTLDKANSHTGGTTIANGGGTLRITDPSALGTGSVTIGTASTNTGTLELALTGTNSITNNFNGFSSANTLTSGGNAQILNTSGNNTITDDLTITVTGGNGLNVASNGGLLTLSGTITHTISTARALSLGGSGDGEVSGSVNNNSTGDVSLALNKSGAGTWTLSNASNTYSGTTTVSGGSLIINGAVASTTVTTNAYLGGRGTMASATIGGSGSVNPGNSPGIMTAAATNPTGGLDYNFELTAEGAAPTWSNAAASVNDVLRLTSATPFTAALDAANQVTLYLGVTSIAEGDVFTGGFFTDQSADFLATVNSAVFTYFLADSGGLTTYNGNTYTEYTGPLAFDRSTVLVASADFAGGTVTNGYVTQFTVIPEPSSVALLGTLGAMLLIRRRR